MLSYFKAFLVEMSKEMSKKIFVSHSQVLKAMKQPAAEKLKVSCL